MTASFRRRVAASILLALLASLGSWDLQARALAVDIAQKHPHALAMAKRAVNQTMDTMGQYAALQACFDIHQLGNASAHVQSGQFVLTDHHGIKAADKK